MSFLSGSPSNTLQSIRQPSKNINKDSLVFTYPVIIDDKLKAYTDTIRDFLAIQFITQIKISNTLDLQVAASKANRIQADDRYINPAEELAKNLGSLSRDYSNYYDHPKQVSQYAPNDKYEYQNKINQLRGFIQDQIKNNPAYKPLNPIVSTITIENLLDIPLVVGTKQYFVSSSVLFWMLFISAGYSPEKEANPLRLDKLNSLAKIKRVMNLVNVNDYMKFFGSSEIERKKSEEYDDRQPSHRVHKLLSDTESELDITMKYFDRVLDPKKWENEVGIYSNDSLTVQIGNTLPKLIVIRKSIIDKCNALFGGLMADKVAPLFISVANALVSNDELDVSAIISKKLEDISSTTSALFEQLFDGIISGTVNEEDTEAVDRLQAKLDTNSNICKVLPTIPVENILRDLRQAYFGLTKTNTNEFASFVEKVVKVSAQASASVNILEKFVFRLASDDASRLKDIFKRYKKAVEKHIYYERMNPNDLGEGFGLLDNFTREVIQRDANNKPIQVADQPTFGNRIRMLLGGNNPQEELLRNLGSALSNLIYFISLYCFLAYVCEYFKTLVEKLEIQKRDSLEFPNYCLVIRASVVEKLYTSLAALSFQKQKTTYNAKLNSRGKAEEDQEQIKNALAPFKLNEKHMMNMVRLINERLCVPNLIVIDEKSKSVYYKFMFNSSGQDMGNISIDNMKTFITHQKDVFQVY
jgi:hypothetical protein